MPNYAKIRKTRKGSKIMKKLVTLIIAAALAATALVSCGNSTVVNNAVAASTGEKITDMTAEKAAGTYYLTEMNEIGGDSKITVKTYDTNRITLTAGGDFTLEVKVAEGDAEVISGTYNITSDGRISLSDGIAIAAVGEQIECNGTKLIASGSLGSRMTAAMVYEKDKVEKTEDKTDNTDDTADKTEDTAE